MDRGYRLGEWTVRPHRSSIERGRESIHLAPKAMAVLDCLARASNSVVTRQEIFDSVWPRATIADDVLTQRIAELRRAFGDSAQQPGIIETIPKIGFRLIPPVTPLPEEFSTGEEAHGPGKSGRAWKWLAAAAAVLVVVALVLGLYGGNGPASHESLRDAENPTIAVLPFLNMSEDPANEYFSDGISEELINLLVEVPGLDVISRTSSFSFKGEHWKMADLARELNASLIVEGTVRKVDDKVRITAQLIDPETDKHLWSESFDRKLADIFSVQEEIAQSIVTALQDEIGAHTVVGSRPTGNIEAYELFLSGRHYFYQRGPVMDKAIRLLKMAVKMDPEFAEAWAHLAAAASVAWVYQTDIGDEEATELAERAATRALELNPGMGLALAAQAMRAYGYEGNLIKGFHLIDRAAEEYPYDTTIRLWAGMYTHHWGYLEEALQHFQYAFRHNPRAGIASGMLGQVYMEQGREDLAVPRFAKATELGWPLHVHTQASLHMMRGDFDAGFAFLKVAFADPGTGSDPLPWLFELEETARAYSENLLSTDVLVSVVERAPGDGVWGQLYLYLFFDLKDEFFQQFALTVRENHLWSMIMMIVWLPEYRAYVEDPRFLEIMRADGALDLWQHRGFPDGCTLAVARLDCSERYGATTSR